MRITRWFMVVLLALVLSLASCSMFGPTVTDDSWRGKVGHEQVRVELAGVVVDFPADVAPAGTRATVEIKPAAEAAPKGLAGLSEVVSIQLDDGVQPEKPVELTIPINIDGSQTTEFGEQYILMVETVGENGVSYEAGSFDAGSGNYSVTVDHFSDFRILGLDIGEMLSQARTAVFEGIGLEHPAPDCVNVPAEVARTEYAAVSPPGTWLCVAEENGNLVLTAYPATAMPYAMNTEPAVNGTTTPSDVQISNSGLIAFANMLGFIAENRTGVFPGAAARYEFEGAPVAVTVQLDQYPALLLMSILATTLDTLGLTTIDQLEQLQCFVDTAEASSALQQEVNGEAVGAFTKAFFSCAGTVADLSPLGKFLIGALGAAPAFLVSSAVGIINEVTGQASNTVDLQVTLQQLSDQELVNAVLPANVCWTGRSGWEHDVPMELVNGVAEARNADGSFAGAAIRDARVIGRADLNGDGEQEVVLALTCTGSPHASCCAGRASIMDAVAVFSDRNGRYLELIAPTLMGGNGPQGTASRRIGEVSLFEDVIVATESVIYPETTSSAEAGGDPHAPVTVEYRLENGVWIASRP